MYRYDTISKSHGLYKKGSMYFYTKFRLSVVCSRGQFLCFKLAKFVNLHLTVHFWILKSISYAWCLISTKNIFSHDYLQYYLWFLKGNEFWETVFFEALSHFFPNSRKLAKKLEYLSIEKKRMFVRIYHIVIRINYRCILSITI